MLIDCGSFFTILVRMRGIHMSLVARSRSFLLESVVILFVFPQHKKEVGFHLWNMFRNKSHHLGQPPHRQDH